MTSKRQTPSESQRKAITAAPGALLVLAGPGAGKTFCLIERIRYLIDELHIDAARICAFTYTNKAAGEIGARLKEEIGPSAENVKKGTMHAFCADLLRAFGAAVGVAPGFGIADEDYQRDVLCRLDSGQRKWYKTTLRKFSAHRLRNDPLYTSDLGLLERYERYLAEHNQLDFDTIIIRAAEVLQSGAAAEIKKKWDVVLVDEFQDLNPIQYGLARDLVAESKHLFAVGDDEQSVFAWNGADPRVFQHLLDDFASATKFYLGENYRCAKQIFTVARRLVSNNPVLFDDRTVPIAERETAFPVEAYEFESDGEEAEWLLADILRERGEADHDLSEVAILYRKHSIGENIETALITGGIPCRLALGRALSDDPIVGHLVAALRVIAFTDDDVHRDAFFSAMLPKTLCQEMRTKAEARQREIREQNRRAGTQARDWDLRHQLNEELATRPRSDANRRHINRALYAWKNLEALGKRHTALDSLAMEILAGRVGAYKTVLEDRHEDLSDPAAHPEVVKLAKRLADARDTSREIWIEKNGGVEVALKGMLIAAGYANIRIGKSPSAGAEIIRSNETPALGSPLGLFKAMQLNAAAGMSESFRDFTVIDLETTDNNAATAEVVEIAAVRVRDGKIVEEFQSLVRPMGSISGGATSVHHISAKDLEGARRFEEVWPEFHAFCGSDVLVAHNGFEFDFQILRRLAKPTPFQFDFTQYDTLLLAKELLFTSRRLSEIAKRFDIDPGNSHRALDDTRTLAQVFPKLRELQAQRERKTALGDVLDYLALGLWLDGEPVNEEAKMLRGLLQRHPLWRYSRVLEFYEHEVAGDESVPPPDEVIGRLGGAELLARMRTERTPNERYPATMQRLRALLDAVTAGTLAEQIRDFLARAALSKFGGEEPEEGRVNLLTLHATKGLEFSRVYIVGLEDRQSCCKPNGNPMSPDELAESRRLAYVGMTRAKDRLVLTRVKSRGGEPTGGHQFIDELGIELREI